MSSFETPVVSPKPPSPSSTSSPGGALACPGSPAEADEPPGASMSSGSTGVGDSASAPRKTV
eukprot:2200899-Lingulodinium_polyedra.AAC.1